MTENNTGLPPLSKREAQIVPLLQYGLTDPQIGAKIGVSPDTVKTHLRRINQKWGTTGRVQIVVTAYQYGVLALPDAPVREAASGATNKRLWECVDAIRYEIGLPRLEFVDAETVLASTESGVRQIVRTNYLLSTARDSKPLAGVERVG